ncbi:hypothetical protein A3SI_09782 [Nitritalea halalkaliphila LW7]|uniref:Uncharacterized protein n=2 Tax=Nitritalea TaxID=1187887 RepID=I5C3S8_9BACT|nr:hypothetical protein A3SI_09782 [Nitritalea halalkaliphila LW7]
MVQGRVQSQSGEGLPAMLSLKETRKGTVADMEGNFTLKDYAQVPIISKFPC